MALDRICELIIGENAEGLLVSGLDVDFNIERSLTFSENTAEFTIYNAKEETRKNVLKKDNNLVFRVGYSDEAVGVIFSGNIRESTTVKNGVDWETKIFAVTGVGTDGALLSQYISLSFSAETNLQDIVKNLSNLYGMVVYGLENADIVLQNGWVYTGLLGGAFRYVEDILKSNNKGIYRDLNEIVIFNKGENSKFNVAVLSLTGGLKNIQDITDKESASKTRLKFESLIMPQVQVNGLVNIKHPNVEGFFTVEKLTYSGNNYGGDFNMTGEVFE